MSDQPPSIVLLLASGPVADAEALRRGWAEWHDRVAPADGAWLGSTGGIARDGQWVAAVRYSSLEAAREAGEGPSGPSFLTGATTVELADGVHLVEGNGPPAAAGFVQLMRARVPDRRRFEAVEAAVGVRFAALRRDFLTGLRAWAGPDGLRVVDWFTSEADARAGEALDVPSDLGALFGEWMSLLHDVEWYDLPEPWQVTPDRHS